MTGRSTRSGCEADSATEMLAQLTGKPTAPPADLVPGRLAPRRVAVGGQALLLVLPMSAAKVGRMFKVKGSERFIWKTSGRQDTWGHTSTPSAQAASCSAITFSW